MRNSIFTAPAALLVLSVTTGGAWSAEPIDQTVSTTADGRLAIENIFGKVFVEGWDRNEVHVTGELGEGADRVEVESRGGRVDVRVILPRDGHPEGTNLIIKAPKGNSLEISTVSADTTVNKMHSGQRISTVSGHVFVSRAQDHVEIKSVSGSLYLAAAHSVTESTLSSVSGDVAFIGVSGRVTGKSVSGDVSLSGINFAEVALASTSGDIRVNGSVDSGAVLKLKTMSGDISVSVVGDIGGEFDLSTVTGDIDNCFGPEPEEKDFGPGSTLRFSEGEGDGEVRMTTMSGDIELCRKSLDEVMGDR